jgi:hypothetical protein
MHRSDETHREISTSDETSFIAVTERGRGF